MWDSGEEIHLDAQISPLQMGSLRGSQGDTVAFGSWPRHLNQFTVKTSRKLNCLRPLLVFSSASWAGLLHLQDPQVFQELLGPQLLLLMSHHNKDSEAPMPFEIYLPIPFPR